MDNTPSNLRIITDLTENVEGLFFKFWDILTEDVELNNDNDLGQLEKKLHSHARELADHIAAIKLQQQLNKEKAIATSKALMKSQPARMKNVARRTVKIKFLGGNTLPVSTEYYHRASAIKKHNGRRGVYPGLLLMGITDRQTPALESMVSLLATASSSFLEASELIFNTLGFKPDIKVVKKTVKRFAEKVRSAAKLDEVNFPDDFKGRVVGASTDGGRIRIRVNKRGNKTKKGRTRYKTDWREPKLIIIYVIGEDGRKERHSLPVMDATLNGPDETFAMLIFYLKKLKVDMADLLLFISDGARWIWERAKKLAHSLGIAAERCLFALDYYHAVEHLSNLASVKRWDKKEKKKWVNLQKRRLIKGKLDAFIEEIERVCVGGKNKTLRREREYFKTHLPHMKYAELKLKGLPIGSGAVESAIRRVINLRLKGPGIFWHKETAEAMLMLRSYYKAGRWHTLENMAYAGGLNMN